MNILNNIIDKARRSRLSCQEVNNFLVEYMEGVIEEEIRVKFEAHVKKCKNCQHFFEQYGETIKVIREDEQLDVPPELFEQTMDFLENNW